MCALIELSLKAFFFIGKLQTYLIQRTSLFTSILRSLFIDCLKMIVLVTFYSQTWHLHINVYDCSLVHIFEAKSQSRLLLIMYSQYPGQPLTLPTHSPIIAFLFLPSAILNLGIMGTVYHYSISLFFFFILSIIPIKHNPLSTYTECKYCLISSS